MRKSEALTLGYRKLSAYVMCIMIAMNTHGNLCFRREKNACTELRTGSVGDLAGEGGRGRGEGMAMGGKVRAHLETACCFPLSLSLKFSECNTYICF